MVLEEQFIQERSKSVKRERPVATADHEPVYDMKYKVPKCEFGSPPERPEDKRRDARLYEMDKERQKVSERRAPFLPSPENKINFKN